VRRILKTEGL